jgi:uncharacterized DUF497 family protein
MEFEWDENKRKSNIQKHGIDFEDAKRVFEGITITFQNNRFDYSEQRFITMGLLYEIVIVIAHTEFDETIRIISMRKATKNEQKFFFKRLKY